MQGLEVTVILVVILVLVLVLALSVFLLFLLFHLVIFLLIIIFDLTLPAVAGQLWRHQWRDVLTVRRATAAPAAAAAAAAAAAPTICGHRLSLREWRGRTNRGGDRLWNKVTQQRLDARQGCRLRIVKRSIHIWRRCIQPLGAVMQQHDKARLRLALASASSSLGAFENANEGGDVLAIAALHK